jgi:membrane protease YdiL (CAAX protease family)
LLITARSHDMSTAVPPPDRRNDPPNRTDDPPDRTVVEPATDQPSLSRREVVAREKERFGGMKFGACFFGWLTATGMAVLLTALVAAAGAGVGLANNLDPANPDPSQADTIGLVGAIVILAIIFVAYFAGGYVAGRMARFNGARQGIGVFLWAVIVAVVVAVLGLVAGTQFNLLANLNTFPRIPVNEGDLTTAGLLTAVAVAIVALVGAILGGVTGMRFHRRVDKEGLGR